MAKFVVLCSKALQELTPEKASAPEADLHPVIAGDVFGVYDDPSDAERDIMRMNCEAHHFILEADTWQRPLS